MPGVEEGSEQRKERRFFVPEVVQTSAMDCGPASLKALLEGYGIPVSYGRLREACQTSVDGTSIDALEDVANQLGLEAEQIMLPADHLFLSKANALPAIVVVRLSNGLTHFVVVWSKHGRFTQVMDPGTGRRWPTWQEFLGDVYLHDFPVPVSAWREWAGSDGFLEPLQQRMETLHVDPQHGQRLIQQALQDPGWRSLAALDASVRMIDAISRAGGIERGQEAARLVEHFYGRGLTQLALEEDIELRFSQGIEISAEELRSSTAIPLPYWSVRLYTDPLPGGEEKEEAYLNMHGAVLVRVVGKRQEGVLRLAEEGEEGAPRPAEPLSPELVAALTEAPVEPLGEVWRLMRDDGVFTPTLIVLALAVSTLGVLLESFLLQGLLQVSNFFPFLGQRTLAVGMFFAFFILLAGLEFPLTASIMRTGRRLETRLRLAFLEKIPRLSDRYFHSRLVSDMTQRAHELRLLRMLPDIGVSFLRTLFQLVLTSLGIIWLDPVSAPLAVVATLFFIGLTLATKPFMDERDLRVRVHLGALDRFYLDAMLGLIPVRSHGAERALRREHESLLVEWVHASLESLQTGRVLQAISAISYSIFAVWIVFNYVAQGGQSSGVLLLFYWTLNLPALGQSLVMQIQQYPMYRNTILRVLEPIKAPDEAEILAEEDIPAQTQTTDVSEESLETPPVFPASAEAVCIEMQDVQVKAGGHTILSEINLRIQAGEHVAIVGASGAGKSSLVGLLLGWHRAESGRIWVDGQAFLGERLQNLRQQTAWVDPAVQLWNRSLLYNLQYGNLSGTSASLQETIGSADLFETMARFPDGLQTILGEGGGLVSGGEGQRVRLARAMMRSTARLVILDEPFRGLDREKRRVLLAAARQHWQSATLLCVTHDVGETQAFPRVLVIEEGKIVEDDAPAALVANPASRYLALLKAEEDVRTNLWASAEWRRFWIEDGQLKELRD